MIRFLIVFIIVTVNCFAQQKSIFDVARNGTLHEIEQLYAENKNCVTEINEYGFSPLILACYKGNTEVAKFLIEKKANLDYVSDEGTALMAAVVKGNPKLTKLLLEKGANPNLTNHNGTTSLMYAVKFKNIEIIKLLLEYKANKSLIDKEGNSAFEYAIQTTNEEIINLLKE
jgi:hypothetical protein